MDARNESLLTSLRGRALGWLVVAALCCAADIAPGKEQEAQLLEAQRAFDEAQTLSEADKYAEAVPLSQRALTIREAVLGDAHPAVADCLYLLGRLLREQKDYAQAEAHLQRALTIREAAFGERPLDVADSLDGLASVYARQGQYGRAVPLYERALAIRESTLGENHSDIADSLDFVASIYQIQGLPERAQPLRERALAIKEATLGKHHPDLEPWLTKLASLYSYSIQGPNKRAERLLQRVLSIKETALGKHHPDVAIALRWLAVFYDRQYMYKQAELLFEQVLTIREAAFGSHHANVASALDELANIYAKRNLYARAEPLHKRALAIYETTLGQHHPRVAYSLDNLAHLYEWQGLYSRAEPLRVRALAIQEAYFGKHHRDLAAFLSNLASLYVSQGWHSRAEPLYERALVIQEASFGKYHPFLVHTLNSLARVHHAQHRVDKAVTLFERAFAISEQRLRQEALSYSESRLAGFLQELRRDEERIYSLLRRHPTDVRVQRLALATVLLRKGRSAEEIADTSRTIYRRLSAQDRETFERLRGLRTQVAQLSLSSPGSPSSADTQQRIQALADEGDTLETELARRSAPLRALTALPPPAEIVGRVAASLPPGSALVEFVAYTDEPVARQPGLPKTWVANGPNYLALVLFPDARIQVVDLGPSTSIGRAAADLREALARRAPDIERPAQALYSKVFQPLLPLLGNVRRLFLAPDGRLGLVPFDTLHDGKGFLIDSFEFSYLNSGRDLLARAQEPAPASSVVVLADPAMGASSAMPAALPTVDPSASQRSPALERFFSTWRYGLGPQDWTPLPGTRREAEAIHRMVPQAQLFLGTNATKQRLLQLATPGILHIATHGFFFDGGAASRSSRGVGQFGGFGHGAPVNLPTDPLLRSGLVLSGAHASTTLDTSEAARSQAESSLVTALELAGLDLWGTQLVVLSACDTGRGDIQPGQGVYGLRRAFSIAGAETVVMSLWKVNDDSTSELMTDYYRHLLAGKGRAESLRDAIRALRVSRPHPYYWGPFISLGQDAPLRSLAPTPLAKPHLPGWPRHVSPGPR